MRETAKPSAPIKSRRGFFKNPWVPVVLIICLIIVWGLNTTGYITLPHINLLNYFENLNAPSFTPEPIGVPITYDLAPGLIALLNPGDTASPATNYSFYLGTEAGSPPTGLNLDTDGTLKGTPTVAGKSSFQVCIKDAAGKSACGMYYMAITPEPASSEKIIFSPPESLEATELTAYSYSFCKPDSAQSGATCGGLAGETTSPTGGKPPYSFSVQFEGLLPPGLALEPNGLLKGKPLLTGKYPFGVCASDGQDKVCGNITLTVTPKAASKPTPTPTPKTSCPANSHKNPSDASKCLCNSGYETNSAGNGCVVASTPTPTPSSSCPANSHKNPLDSTKCFCDTGYQTNSAGDGCAVASTPLLPPSPSCPTNSHQNPSDSTRCLCNSGYETNSAGNGCAVASTPPPPPPSSCPANSHQDPADASKCLCDSGYETNSAGNGCVVASTPPPPPPSSCPANSHQDPADASKCLCDTGYETNSAGDGCVVAETFDVEINSLICFFTYIPNDYGTMTRYNQAIVRGTVQGPVGARLELPILGWPDDVWDCGGWTQENGGWVTVGETCIRGVGQPETTNWSVDTGGEETGGYDIGEDESYIAKLFSKDPFGDNLLPRKVAQASTVCQ